MVRVAKTALLNKESDYPKFSEGKWWSSAPDGEAKIVESETGNGSFGRIKPMTLSEAFERAVQLNGNRIAVRSEEMPPLAAGEKPPPALPLSEWKSKTWKEYYDDARAAGKAMIALGLERHDSCNVFGFNSIPWTTAALGAILAGGKIAGIYPTDTADQVQYKSDHSNGAVAVVENDKAFAKFKENLDNLPKLSAIICWACEPGDDLKTKDGRVVKTMSWEDFLQFGRDQPDDAINQRMTDQKPGNACALIYTSGTTGYPKAVMVTHDNLIFNATSVMQLAGVVGIKNEEERIISYLPLSHVAGFMLDIVVPLTLTANLDGWKGWAAANFARSYDMKTGTLVARLQAVRPTLFIGVPRVWEKIKEKLTVAFSEATGTKAKLMAFARKASLTYQSSRQLGGTAKTPAGYTVAKVLLKKVKAKLGLDKSKFNFVGAAPTPMEVYEFFGSIGINLNEVYGMSETTGVSVWSTDKYHKWGSAGFEIPSVEVRILKKGADGKDFIVPDAKELFAPTEDEQGEICYRGRNIMMGYMANPRLGAEHMAEIDKKNEDAIDKFGWMHSGDKGARSADGLYRVTGRYKELIITAGGENIAPVPIEDEIKKLAPFISNIMMIGNLRKFNVCVVTLKAVGATGELPGTNQLAPPASTMSTSKTITEAMKDEVIIKAITDVITAVNKNEKVVISNAAKIQKFTILPRDFSVVTDELTATLKLKRGVVDEEFKPIIDKMYTSKDAYVPYELAPTPGVEPSEA